MQNCTNLDSVLERYFLTSIYAVEFCLGSLGNLVVMLGYVFCLKEWQSCNIYIFNLAVSDLVFLCTLPRLSYLYANRYLEVRPYMCVINRYILHVNLYSSILFMAWLSMDRFLVVKYPQRNHRLLRNKTALLVTALTWLAVNVEVTPMIVLMVQDLQRRKGMHCKDFASLKGDVNTFAYSLGLTVTGYVLPLMALCIFSYKISRLLRERAQARKTALFRRPLRVVASVTAMFLVLYTPYHVMRNIRIASWKLWPRAGGCTRTYIKSLYILTRPLAFLHSVINPVFYFLMGDKFRELFLAKLRKLCGRSRQQGEAAGQS